MSKVSATSLAQRGFTLIEVMIVVVIVAILAAVAVPAYTDYLRRGQDAEAPAIMATQAIKMEQYYQDNRNYGTGSTCGVTMPASPAVRYFGYGCEVTNSGQDFTITATGASGQTNGKEVYTLKANNVRETTKFKGVNQTGKGCWLVKGDEC